MHEIPTAQLVESADTGSVVRLLSERLHRSASPARAGEAPNQELLDRLLSYIEAAERRLAEQDRRIAYLQGLSMTDELTGLLNRRGFCEQFKRVLASSRRYGHQGLLLYCDLDGFKAINDRLGHAAGDGALKHVAATLEGSVRATDIVGRLGGDEFAVALVQTSLADGAKRAQSLKWEVEGHPFRWQAHEITIQMSMGEQPFGPDDVVEDLLCRADMAMYYCKRQKAAALSLPAAE